MSSLSSPSRLGWIGLGSMGQAMAVNIQKYLSNNDYPALRYTNRTMSRGTPLQELGSKPCHSIAELVENSDIIFISLSDDAILTSTITEILAGPTQLSNKIIIDTTTVHPNTSSTVSAQLQAAGASFIAAPVFGATPIAQAGQLLIAVAGPEAAIQKISPFLKGVISRDVIHASDDPAKALLLKTTSNFITAGMTYLLSEAHVLAEKSGLSASTLESLIGQNFGQYAYSVSKRITDGIYYPAVGEEPFSGLELGMKDVGHGLGLAKEAGMELKVGDLVMGCMEKAKKVGEERGRKMDSSSIYGVVRTNAGLGFESEGVKKRDEERQQENVSEK